MQIFHGKELVGKKGQKDPTSDTISRCLLSSHFLLSRYLSPLLDSAPPLRTHSSGTRPVQKSVTFYFPILQRLGIQAEFARQARRMKCSFELPHSHSLKLSHSHSQFNEMTTRIRPVKRKTLRNHVARPRSTSPFHRLGLKASESCGVQG